MFPGSSRHTSRSASNLLSSTLNTTSYVSGRRQSSSAAGYSAGRQSASIGGTVQSPMSTPKSGAGGLRTPRSTLRTSRQPTPKSEPRSASLHSRRLSSTTSKTGATQKNGLSLAVREPASSLPSSPHSSDPDSLDQPGDQSARLYLMAFCYGCASD